MKSEEKRLRKVKQKAILFIWSKYFNDYLRQTFINCSHFVIFILTICIHTCYSTMPCLDNFWWDSYRNECVECSRCDGEQILTKRPCQLHMDTVCGTFKDVDDWNWSTQTDERIESNWKERRKEFELTELSNRTSSEIIWNWEAVTATIFAILVVLCLIAGIYIMFVKHWRHMKKIEQRFDRDIKELSACLMHHTIVDMRALDNGQIILEDKDRMFNPMEIRCIYLDEILANTNLAANSGRGNVYIEEANNTVKS